MAYKLGACKGCKERREWLAKRAEAGKQVVSKVVANVAKIGKNK